MVLSGDGAFRTLLLSAPHSPWFFLGRRFLGCRFLGCRFLGRHFLGRCFLGGHFLGRRFLDTWHLTIASISKTWITEHLDSVVRGYVRKWLDIPISGTLSNAFLGRNKFGLNIFLPVLINSSNWQCFLHKMLYVGYHTENTQRVMGKNSGGKEALQSRDKGTRREALLGGDKIEWYRG